MLDSIRCAIYGASCAIYGGKDQEQRNQSIRMFKKAKGLDFSKGLKAAMQRTEGAPASPVFRVAVFWVIAEPEDCLVAAVLFRGHGVHCVC